MSTKKVLINEREYTVNDPIMVSQNGLYKLFKSTDSDNNPYIIKALSSSDQKETELKYYKMESRLLDLFKNDYIVKMLGKRELTNKSNGNRQVAFLLENCSNTIYNIAQMHNNAKFKEDTIKKIISDVGNGLLFIHKNKFIHGNINQESILLGGDGKFKIGELGCCVHESNFSHPSMLELLISPVNKPPEMKLLEYQLSYKIDIWQLGRLLHILMMKAEPIMEEESYAGNSPLINIVKACLRRNPNDRPSISEVLQMLQASQIMKIKEENQMQVNQILNSMQTEERQIPKPPEQGKPKSGTGTKNLVAYLTNSSEEEINEIFMINVVKKSWDKPSSILKCYENLHKIADQSNSIVALKLLIFLHFYLMKGDSKVLSENKILEILNLIQSTWKNANSVHSKIMVTYSDLLNQFFTIHSKYRQYIDGNTSLILDSFKNSLSLSFIPEFLFLLLKLWKMENSLIDLILPIIDSQLNLFLYCIFNLQRDYLNIFRLATHFIILIIKSQFSKVGKSLINAPDLYTQNVILVFEKNYQKMLDNFDILTAFSDSFNILNSMPKNLIKEINQINAPPSVEPKFNVEEIINESSCFLNISLPIFPNKIPEFNKENINFNLTKKSNLPISKNQAKGNPNNIFKKLNLEFKDNLKHDNTKDEIKKENNKQFGSNSKESLSKDLLNEPSSTIEDLNKSNFPIFKEAGESQNLTKNPAAKHPPSRRKSSESLLNLFSEKVNNNPKDTKETELQNLQGLIFNLPEPPQKNQLKVSEMNKVHDQNKNLNQSSQAFVEDKKQPEKKQIISKTEIIEKIIVKDASNSFLDIEKSCHAEEKDVKFGELIGMGATAEVYKGLYRGTEVAIKKMKQLANNPQFMKDFKREVSTLMELRHPNLVLFMGIFQAHDSFCLITEFCSGGNLFSLLHEKRQIKISWKQRCKMAIQIAKGMNFLHSFNPPIIHRDLKSLNILLSEEVKGPNDFVNVKITDFGLARTQILGNEMMTSFAGTFHWMAPEIIENKPYTIKADVYSFAIIMWEIICRQTPYQNLTGPQLIYKVAHFDERPNLSCVPSDCPKLLKNIMISSWIKDPSKRPSFQKILDLLNKEIDNIQN